MKPYIPGTVLSFWDYARKDGRAPRMVWAMRSLGGEGSQPTGYIQGWSVTKAYVEKCIEKTAGQWEIVKLSPAREEAK